MNERFLAAWRESDEPAVVTDDTSWSGRELIRRVGGAAGWVASIELPTPSVPALVDETPASVALAIGAAMADCPLAPLNTKLPAADVVGTVRALGSPVLVTTPDLLARAEEATSGSGIRIVTFEDTRAGPLPDRQPAGDDTVFVVHTSGTTGAPKPVPASQAALASRCDVYGQILGLGPSDRYWSASPFHHTAGIGMALTALGCGATLLPQAWFSVDAWRASGSLGATVALVVPTMVDLLLEAGALADARPRCLQYGGAPIHVDTLRSALDALPRTEFVQVFGQTEMTPFTCLTHDDHRDALAGRADLLETVGRPAPGVEMRLTDQEPDGVGELCFRGPHAFLPGDDGWVRSGDLGTVDDDGHVRIVGRRHDKIVRGGENIYPREVEDALRTHPAVEDVAVVGVPDRRWGEIVRAVVVPVDASAPPDPDELVAHARTSLAAFKVPADWRFVDELPRNAGGKVLRRQLR